MKDEPEALASSVGTKEIQACDPVRELPPTSPHCEHGSLTTESLKEHGGMLFSEPHKQHHFCRTLLRWTSPAPRLASRKAASTGSIGMQRELFARAEELLLAADNGRFSGCYKRY